MFRWQNRDKKLNGKKKRSAYKVDNKGYAQWYIDMVQRNLKKFEKR